MDYYIEITLLSNSDINLFALWAKTYQQLHLGLVEIQDAQKKVPIGLAFPEYMTGEKISIIGGKCRLFAQDEATLAQFNAAKWLARLSDYVHCTSIRPVPERINGYACYQRLQPKASGERLARRYARRKGIDWQTALYTPMEMSYRPEPGSEKVAKKPLRYYDLPEPKLAAPFIRLQSLSSGRPFRLWIQKTAAPEPVYNGFTSYGLSATSTVPEFG